MIIFDLDRCQSFTKLSLCAKLGAVALSGFLTFVKNLIASNISIREKQVKMF